MPPIRREIRTLVGLALPVAGAQVGSMLLGTVDTLMVARIDVDALAAAAMANAWIFGVLLVGQGIVHGMDPVVSRAHGAGDGRAAALAFQRGVVLAVLVSLPLAGLLAVTEGFLLLTGQEPKLAAAAGGYARVQIPSIPVFLLFMATRQYLQGRAIMRPAMWVVLAANVLNVVFNRVLIFGGLGIPALGLEGAGIATSLSRLSMAAGLALFVRAFALHEGAWTPWSRAAYELAALRRLFAVGVPIAIQMSLEIWAFSAATLLAGRLGADAVAAHTIVLNMAALAFMLPLGVSQGAVTRVGNLLGAGHPGQAQRAAWVAIGMGGAVMTVSAVSFVVLRNALPALYTSDVAVVALCASILPIAGAFQLFDGVQVVSCGVLRGMGKTRPAAWFNLVGYWVLGLPLAGWLAFRTSFGLAGIWWGLCLGLGVVATALVFYIRGRGPGRQPTEVSESVSLASG